MWKVLISSLSFLAIATLISALKADPLDDALANGLRDCGSVEKCRKQMACWYERCVPNFRACVLNLKRVEQYGGDREVIQLGAQRCMEKIEDCNVAYCGSSPSR
jgi:hypothetical protein